MESDEVVKDVKVQKKRCEGIVLTWMRGRKRMIRGWKRERKEIPEKEELLVLSSLKSDWRSAYLFISTSLL
jgi:hypothetical protein